MVAATLLVTAVAGLVGSLASSDTVTEALVIVPSGASAEGPGAAGEATRLAVTYAGAIPDDDGVQRAVSRRLGWSPDTVSDSISVTNPPDTAVLRISFEAPDRRESLAGAEAIVGALVGPAPMARSVAPNSLQSVRAPETVDEAGGIGGAIPVGIVLGLALGVVLAVAWERADPRFDTSEQLAEAMHCEATSLDRLAPDAAAALVGRWRDLTGGSRRVTLVAATRDRGGSVLRVAGWLSEAAEAGGMDVRVSSPDELDREGPGESLGAGYGSSAALVLVVGGVPGGHGAAERAALLGDALVVVVPRGARRAEAIGAVQFLSQLTGKGPSWALLVGKLRPLPSTAARPEPVPG